MAGDEESHNASDSAFHWASWYDRTINWSARIERELPTVMGVFGPPGPGGILDAGCGPGRSACALAGRGYRVIGADISPEMVLLAKDNAVPIDGKIEFVEASFARLFETVGGGHDGLLCVGNSLVAAGTQEAVHEAIGQFAACLRPGGRLFVQVLNFLPMREETPCVRGPRVVTVDGIEYISHRHFHFEKDRVTITSVTVFKDGEWRHRAHAGRLYPLEPNELVGWCAEAGLRVDDQWSDYTRRPFQTTQPGDYILTATRI